MAIDGTRGTKAIAAGSCNKFVSLIYIKVSISVLSKTGPELKESKYFFYKFQLVN